MLCFCRGGQRSQIAAQWIHDAGGSVQRIEGLQAMRNQMLPLLAPDPSTIAILGDQRVLEKQSSYKTIRMPLTWRARESSRFGLWRYLSGQPSQIDFENAVALEFFKRQPTSSRDEGKNPTLLEDEGRMIGRIHLPPPLQRMQQAPLLFSRRRWSRGYPTFSKNMSWSTWMKFVTMARLSPFRA